LSKITCFVLIELDNVHCIIAYILVYVEYFWEKTKNNLIASLTIYFCWISKARG